MVTLAGRQLLLRVEMWCGIRWAEAEANLFHSLADNDSVGFAMAAQDSRDWVSAMRIVNGLRLGMVSTVSQNRKGESADARLSK